MESILSLDHIYYSYHDKNGETPVINDLSFEIKPGSFTSIVGPSGCGKSTLLSLLCDLIKPEAGTIYIRPPENNTDSRMGYMLQKDMLLPWRTIIDNIILGLEIKGVPKREARKQALPLMEKYGLSGFEKNYPCELSGGMRQRAALLRTLLYDREIILLDEPFGALDAFTRVSLQDRLIELWKSIGYTAIMVTHDVEEAVVLSQKVVVMTGRPAKVSKIFEINQDYPRNRNSIEMVELKQKILEEMHI